MTCVPPRIRRSVALSAILTTGLLALLATSASSVSARQTRPPAPRGAKAAATATPGATPAAGVSGGKDWKDVDRLVSEQKFAEALKITSERRAAAQKAGDEAEWTRGLIRETQLTIGLHGYETAVRALREHPWPKGLAHRAVLELYHARSLDIYRGMYSWEKRATRRARPARRWI
jgi:hypothetical protein